MRRRSALIGLGAMFTGAIGVVGTGAFSAVEADRTASVNVAGDASALLGLEAVDKHEEYIDTTNGTIGINIDGTDEGAQGVNKNAVTVIDPLIKVTNNGTARITVGFNDALVVERDDPTYNSNPVGWTYAGDEDAYIILWGPYDDENEDFDPDDKITRDNLTTTGFTGSSGSGLVDDSYAYFYEDEEDREIGTGESLEIGCTVDTRDDTLDSGPPSELDDTFTLFAEQV